MKSFDPQAIRYVFVDRDGVLNRKMPEGAYVTGWAQFKWLPGAREAIARMNQAQMTVILVTNQRGIALGILNEQQLRSIHAKMEYDLARRGARVDAIYYCPHDYGQCHCRKPDIGLFEQAFRQFPEASPQNSAVIGDSLPDVEAGKRLGMRTIFVLGEPGRQKPGSLVAIEEADAVAGSLLEAVESHLGLIPR